MYVDIFPWKWTEEYAIQFPDYEYDTMVISCDYLAALNVVYLNNLLKNYWWKNVLPLSSILFWIYSNYDSY